MRPRGRPPEDTGGHDVSSGVGVGHVPARSLKTEQHASVGRASVRTDAMARFFHEPRHTEGPARAAPEGLTKQLGIPPPSGGAVFPVEGSAPPRRRKSSRRIAASSFSLRRV